MSETTVTFPSEPGLYHAAVRVSPTPLPPPPTAYNAVVQLYGTAPFLKLKVLCLDPSIPPYSNRVWSERDVLAVGPKIEIPAMPANA